MNSAYKLSDEAIVALVKMLQLAMLTGTDISDWYRMIRLVHDDSNAEGLLVLDPEYGDMLEDQIRSLEKQANEMLMGVPDDGKN